MKRPESQESCPRIPSISTSLSKRKDIPFSRVTWYCSSPGSVDFLAGASPASHEASPASCRRIPGIPTGPTRRNQNNEDNSSPKTKTKKKGRSISSISRSVSSLLSKNPWHLNWSHPKKKQQQKQRTALKSTESPISLLNWKNLQHLINNPLPSPSYHLFSTPILPPTHSEGGD